MTSCGEYDGKVLRTASRGTTNQRKDGLVIPLLLLIILILVFGVIGALKLAFWVFLIALLAAVAAAFVGRTLISR